MILAQYLAYFLYLLACIFLFLVVRNFIRRRVRRMAMFLIISMLSSGAGHMIQQKVENVMIQTASHYTEEVMDRIGK